MSNVVKIVFFNNFALEVTLTRNRFMRTLQPTVYRFVFWVLLEIFSLPRMTVTGSLERREEEMSARLLRRSEATKRRFGKGRGYTTSHKMYFF